MSAGLLIEAVIPLASGIHAFVTAGTMRGRPDAALAGMTMTRKRGAFLPCAIPPLFLASQRLALTRSRRNASAGWRLVGIDTIGAFEAKTHLSSLLERVAQGKTFTITRQGKPVRDLCAPSNATRSASRQGSAG